MQDDASGKGPDASATDRTTAKTPESEFLRQQADDARRAIADTLTRMQQSLKDSGDVKAWTREYPWPSLGVAAACGFLTAVALAPSRHRGRRQRLSAVVDDLLSEEELDESPEAPRRPKRSALCALLGPLVKVLVGALQSAIVAAATARTQPPPEASSNGHQPTQSDA